MVAQSFQSHEKAAICWLRSIVQAMFTTRYRESFFYRSALLWNSLPHDIQSLKNSKSFRDALENHYQSYYRKRGSASYIVREVLLVRERERDTDRERER